MHPSYVGYPGLPVSRLPPPWKPEVGRDGTLVVKLPAIAQPQTPCRMWLVGPDSEPVDMSNRVVHRLDQDATISFELLLVAQSDALTPGIYQLEYAVGKSLQGHVRFEVPDSPLNPKSALFDQKLGTGNWRWSKVLDYALNGATSIEIQLPAEFDNLNGGMGFCVRRDGLEDPDALVRILSRTQTSITVTCSPLRSDHVIRCIFY